MSLIRTASFAVLTVMAAGAALGGPLSPPSGPVSGTMKTIQEVEPRIAINATNTPGDADSVYRITQSGSYYLPASITGVAVKTTIEIEAPNVTVDLNGFAISGGQFGIRAANGVYAPTVRNGVIANTVSYGIYMAACTGARIENVTVHHSGTGAGAAGISSGNGSIVHGCIASENQWGIQTGNGSRVINCVAKSNLIAGFSLGSGMYGVTFESCTAESNGTHGFSCLSTTGVRIDGCVAMKNGSNGIYAGAETEVTRNTVTENGMHGIQAATDCTVSENRCFRNGGASTSLFGGVYVTGAGNMIERNRCSAGEIGIWVAGGTDNVIVGNWCRGHTSSNFTIVAGNEFAPVINGPGTTFTGVTAMSNFMY